MRFQRLALLALLPLTAIALPAYAQGKRSLIVFKDGFTIQGKIKRPTTYIIDPVSRESFTIPVAGGFYTLDDDVRNISFSPNQVLEVVTDDPSLKREWVRLNNTVGIGSRTLPKSWSVVATGPFDDRWMRPIMLSSGGKQVQLDQRLVFLTPRHLRIDARGFEWMSYYFTRELGPEVARSLVYKHGPLTKQTLKEIDERLLVYRFLLQGGWTAEAEKELEKIVRQFPAQRARLQSMQEALTKLLTIQFVDGLELAHKTGQHQEAQERLARFGEQGMAAQVSDKTLVQVQALKNLYQAANVKLKDARRFFKVLPTGVPPVRRDFFRKAVAAIDEELNHDTLPRLETFLAQARDWERAQQQKRAPGQTPEELLAFAVSGWLLGDGAAEKSVETAKGLWEAREMVLACQRDEDPGERKQRWTSFPVHHKTIGVDVIARMIPLLPPPEPCASTGTEPIQLKVAGAGIPYQVQLPPEYHPYRSYPVLFVLHHSAETPAQTLGRWTELAARNGYILVAPSWARGFKPTYQYTEREHFAVTECLRDLRRRFQVDSDRVFLFGCEQGGRMAYDVGLSHPDLFAGVLPMSAPPAYHSFRYWTNAQYLPFYVVNGDHTGATAKSNRALFKDWIRWNYPALSVEYKGRAAEWFEAEPELMIDWMNRKKRANPQKALGRTGEEFKTMRPLDNRFYWLSTDAVLPRFLNNAAAWNSHTPPATLYARIFIDNQINVRTHGLGQLTIWLGPGMVNYAQKVKVNVNSSVWGPRMIVPKLETLLEDFCYRGDRQRLFWARIDLQLLKG